MSHWAKGAPIPKLFPPMTAHSLPSDQSTYRSPARSFAVLVLLALALAAGSALLAQVEGDRGINPVASSSDIDVNGIEVNVTGDNAEDARQKGWKLAQRGGWEKLGGPNVSDSDLDGMVSGIVIESEQVGPRRYIATLGVIFDRTKAGPLLGTHSTGTRSAPMLTIPVLESGGAFTVYEIRNSWQRAWAQFQAGASAIDYVRPSGAGGDSLLITYGQVGRRSRDWWRNILDEFGAADVLVPVVNLERQWPGGPVKARFTARYGPDNRFLESFTMEAKDEDGIPAMFEGALERFDTIYTRALDRGLLRPDPTLRSDRLTLDPTIAALIDSERQIMAAEEAVAGITSESIPVEGAATGDTPQVVNSYVVQFVTPDASSVDAGIAAVRAVPGVRGAATSSIAIGGTSVMRVSYSGSLDSLAAAMRSRGWTVIQGSSAISISR